MTRDWEVMAVDITTSPTFKAGAPRKLFQLPGPLAGNPMQWKNVSPDGQRFIFAMPSSPAAGSGRPLTLAGATRMGWPRPSAALPESVPERLTRAQPLPAIRYGLRVVHFKGGP